MSKLIVEVCSIDEVQSHPNADRLELAIVKGFQSVVGKGTHKAGDVIVYIPYDTIVPVELSDKYGFTKYLDKGRVKPTKLRGEPTYGVIIPNEKGYPIGTSVADELGLTKYIPRVRRVGGGGGGRCEDEESPHPLFPKYTELENLRHYPNTFRDGEEVTVSEKIHGCNNRIAMVGGVAMAGSRRLQRKPPVKEVPQGFLARLFRKVLKRPAPTTLDYDAAANSMVWCPWSVPAVREMMADLGAEHQQVVLFGEVFGKNVQKGVRYGSPDKLAYRAFDLILDGKYVDRNEFQAICRQYDVDTAPELYVGPYSLDKVKELSKGKTTVGEGETHIREGVVVKPVIERYDPKVGRVILKYVSEDYLVAKDIGDFEDE